MKNQLIALLLSFVFVSSFALQSCTKKMSKEADHITFNENYPLKNLQVVVSSDSPNVVFGKYSQYSNDYWNGESWESLFWELQFNFNFNPVGASASIDTKAKERFLLNSKTQVAEGEDPIAYQILIRNADDETVYYDQTLTEHNIDLEF